MMKPLFLLFCIVGSTLSAPAVELVELEILLAAQQAFGSRQSVGSVLPSHGFIKEIPQMVGKESFENLQRFGLVVAPPSASIKPALRVLAKGDDDDDDDIDD